MPQCIACCSAYLSAQLSPSTRAWSSLRRVRSPKEEEEEDEDDEEEEEEEEDEEEEQVYSN